MNVAKKPKTNKAWQAEHKVRMREGGYVQITVWIKKEHKERIKEYIKTLNEKDNEQ